MKPKPTTAAAAIDPQRSQIMRAIAKKNTRPEIAARQMLHAMGLRFRLHRRDLPGTPDIVLPRHKTAIQVHGCFWHQHLGCRHAKMPRTRPEYWVPKLAPNVERDAQAKAALEAAGWRVLAIWECETKKPEKLRHQLTAAFNRPRPVRGRRP